MTTAIFDTPKTDRNLKAAGVDARQAETIVTTMAEAFDDAIAIKASLFEFKADLAGVKADLEQEPAGLKVDFKIFTLVFAPAVIILLLKIVFIS